MKGCWNLINTLNKFRPYTTPEQRVCEVMLAIYPDTTSMEVRRELDYLADRKLVTLTSNPPVPGTPISPTTASISPKNTRLNASGHRTSGKVLSE